MKEYNGLVNLNYPDKPYCIYTIYSEDETDKNIYIGVSSDYNQRAYKHSISRTYKRYKDFPLYIWMNHVIEEKNLKVMFKVIETDLTEHEAFLKEKELISNYTKRDYTILNSTEGGKGPTGRIPWNKGKVNVYTDKQLKKLSESHIGKVGGMLGKNHSTETKNLISLKNKERVDRKWLNPRKKKVYKYNNDNSLIIEYSCLEEAGIKENVSPSSIGEWCRKEKKPKNGFIYSYLKIN
jgi:hypothetical protein